MEEDSPSPSSSPSPSPPPPQKEEEEDFAQVIHEAADQLNRVRSEIATLDHLLKERFLKNAAYRTPASVPLQLIHKMDELSLALHSAIDNLGHYFAFSQKHNLDLETNTCGFLGVLPHELILLVLSFLPPKELLLTISVLNRQLRLLVLDNSLWRSLCFYYFGKRAIHEEELQQQNVYSQYEEDDDDDDDEDVSESSTRKDYLLGGGRKRRKRLKRGRSTSREMHKLPPTTETNKERQIEIEQEKEKERGENGSDKSSEKMAAVVPTRRKEWRMIFVKQCKLERNWGLGNCSVTTLLSDRRAYCIQFSEEKRQLWSGNAKGVLARWDLDTGNFHADMKAHDGAVNCIQLGRKHRDEQQVRRRKTNKTKKHKKSKQQTREQEGDDEEAECGTDELLYTCSCDRTIKVWSQSFESINTKRYLRAVFGNNAGRSAAQQTNSNVTTNDDSHGNSVQMIRVNEKSNQLISCSLDMTLKLWDLQRGGEMSTTSSSSTSSGKCIRTFHDVSTLRCLQMDEESGYILSGGSDGCIKVWDGRVPPRSLASSSSGEESECVAYFQTGLTKVMAMQFNLKRNINKLIVAGDDGPSGEFSVHIYDLRRTSQPVVSVPVFSSSDYFSSSPPPSHYVYRSSGSPTSHISSSSNASSNLSSFPFAGTSPSSQNSFSLSSLTSLSPLRKPPLSSVPSSSVALPPAPSSSGYLYPPFHHATSPHHSHHHHHHPNRHNHQYRPLFHPHRSSMFPSGSPSSSSSTTTNTKTTKLLASSEENDDEEIEDDENEHENENDEHDEDTKIKEDEEEEEEQCVKHNNKRGLSLGDNSYFKSQSLVGHRDRIWSLQFDFNRLVTGSRDNSVRVWSPLNFTSRDASASLMSEDFWANPTPQSKEEKEERNKGRGKREWRVPTSYELGHPMQRHINSIYWLQFSSQRLVTASADHTLKIWNFAVDLNEAASDREEEESEEEEEEEREYASFTPSFTSLF
ncbi:hypothetical protein QOT17_024661 [Balamuthia mandrillaris]